MLRNNSLEKSNDYISILKKETTIKEKMLKRGII